jgi:hypothetical protein
VFRVGLSPLFCFPGLTLLYKIHSLFAFIVFAIYRHQGEGDEFWTSYDEVCESFDAMGLQENLLRGIYAYGVEILYTS